MTISNILNAKSLLDLLDAAEEFCQNAIMRDNDDECMELKAKLEVATENDYLMILSSYMSVAEDGDEIIEAICEFVANCRAFAEPDMDITNRFLKRNLRRFWTTAKRCAELKPALKKNIKSIQLKFHCSA